MDFKLLFKSILLVMSATGFGSNMIYLIGALDGSVCKPTISITLVFFMTILCAVGTVAGVSLICTKKEENKDAK